ADNLSAGSLERREMKIAITGGTGFLGRNVARLLAAEGHEGVLIARGIDVTDPAIRSNARTRFVAMGLDNAGRLGSALTECESVVHCAGINRELGEQTFAKVHVEGTRHVVEAARGVGVKKIILISFLRARSNCGFPYHESKW